MCDDEASMMMYPIDLNGEWHFCAMLSEDNTDTPQLAAPALPDAVAWQLLQVPGHWGAQGIDHDGVAWYRRTFDMLENEACSVWWLECEGVDYHCDVYINGQHAGAHTGYFGKFRLDVTSYVALGENVIAIRVESPATAPDTPAAQHIIKGILMQPYLPWRRLFDERLATRNTGGIWGRVMLVPYDCAAPPAAEDWYPPLAEPRAQIDPETLAWMLNEMPFKPQGTIYIPAHFPGTMTRRDFIKDIRMMREANIDTIRVYGHILPERFYDICDEFGMLVWQDFPLYDGYLDTPEVHAAALAQAEEMVRQLGGYRSIVAWNVHAEAPWAQPTLATEQNRALDEAIADRIRALDPGRYVHLNTQLPVEFRIFARLKDFLRTFPHEPLPFALGAPAYPGLETLQTLAEGGDVEHLLAGFGAMPEDGESIAEFIEASQDYQAHFLKYALEACRSDSAVAGGYFQHMFVDALPGVSTAVVDYRRVRKAGYRALAVASQRILPLVRLPAEWLSAVPAEQPLLLDLVLVNDSPRRLMGWVLKITLTGYLPREASPDGETFLHHWNDTLRGIEAEPYERISLGTITAPGLPRIATEYNLTLQLFNLPNETQRIIVNTYTLRLVRQDQSAPHL